jgi:hypothetical protein
VSITTIVIAAGGALLALTWLFLIAVLRSHAEILRRLHALESGTGFALGGDRADGADGAHGADGALDPRAAYADSAGAQAPDIVGETLGGDVVKLALGPGAPRTLLAFLSTGCSVCGPLWEELRAGGPAAAGIRIVVVTKGSDRESLTRLERIATARGELLMSNAAWSDYGVVSTPHFVLVGADARHILGRGGGTSWSQILSLLADAESDARLHRARSTSDRAARAEQALAASGIGPEHPSLYPSRSQEGEPDE